MIFVQRYRWIAAAKATCRMERSKDTDAKRIAVMNEPDASDHVIIYLCSES